MKLPKLVKSVTAIVLGYALMVVLIWIVQEGMFDGVGFNKSSLTVLGVAGLLTFGGAVAGGFATGWLAPGAPRAHVLVPVLAVIAETLGFLVPRSGDPVWFDLLAGGSLVFGLLLGAQLAWRNRVLEGAHQQLARI